MRLRQYDSTTYLDSRTASKVPTNSEESPLVPRPFLLCSMKCGFARSTVHRGPLTSTSRGRIHILLSRYAATAIRELRNEPYAICNMTPIRSDDG